MAVENHDPVPPNDADTSQDLATKPTNEPAGKPWVAPVFERISLADATGGVRGVFDGGRGSS